MMGSSKVSDVQRVVILDVNRNFRHYLVVNDVIRDYY